MRIAVKSTLPLPGGATLFQDTQFFRTISTSEQWIEFMWSLVLKLFSLPSRVWFLMTLWTAARRFLCPWDSSDKSTGVGICLPFPSSGDFPDPGIERASPTLAGEFFTTKPPGKCHCSLLPIYGVPLYFWLCNVPDMYLFLFHLSFRSHFWDLNDLGEYSVNSESIGS